MKRSLSVLPLYLLASCSDAQPVELTHEGTTAKILEKLLEVASADDVNVLLFQSVIVAAVLFAVIGFITAAIYRQSKDQWNNFWNYLERRLTLLFALVWLFGFAVYLVGTSIIEADASFFESLESLFCQAPMAFIHAFEMFVLESDVSAIHDKFHESLWFMSCFSLAHLAAAFVSTMFIIKYFGYNLAARAKLWLAVHLKEHVDELYVFWGMNEATYHLAKDINKTYAEGKATGSYRTVIVNTTDDDSEESVKEHTAVDRLFSFLSFRKEELYRYNELNCLTENVFHKIARIKPLDENLPMDVLVKEMDAVSLAKLINKTDKKVHIFLLGDNEEENIIGTAMFCRDTTINAFASSRKIGIYCHARYDSINRVIEDKYSRDNINVKVLDSSHESINILRGNQKFHPVNFVDIDTEWNLGTVKSAFTSLVVGFGETGRDAVRYLYEYGAFVNNLSSIEDDNQDVDYADGRKPYVTKSPFKCYIIDKDAHRLSGQFFVNSPAVSDVYVWNTDIFTPEFFKNIRSICDELNYVVIALGNDELNITTAVRIFNFMRKYRAKESLKKLIIFVRCHNHEQKAHLQHIADHYNQCGCVDEEHEHIIIFGTEDQLYTYDQVIENDFEDEGRHYNALYCEASGKKEEKDQWETRRQLLLEKKTLDALSELRRKESQDIANAYHALTKLHIIRKVIEDGNGNVRPEFRMVHDCLENIRFAPKFKRQDGQIVAEGEFSDSERLLFRNLARLEHIRWSAAHEVLGYQSYTQGDPDKKLVPDEDDKRHRCNETYKLHNCLIDWQELDAEANLVKSYKADYKLYDFYVVTTTFMLHNRHNR